MAETIVKTRAVYRTDDVPTELCARLRDLGFPEILLDAADLIEQQAAEIDRLRAEVAALKNPWRPVDDEARNGETWLLKGKRGRQSAGRYIGRLDAFSIVAGEHWLACDVTHYAPLPPSPNRED